MAIKFVTEYRAEREKKELAIYKEWNRLMSVPNQSATLVTKHIMKKFNLHAPSTVWAIRKRVEDRLSAKS